MFIFLFLLALFSSATAVEIETRLSHPLLAADEENFYLQIDFTGNKISNQDERPPINLAMVIDRSGSMSGEKLAYAKRALSTVVDLLTANDALSLIIYDDEAEILTPLQRLTERNKRQILSLISDIQADGSTALYAGVTLGAKSLQESLSAKRVSRVILLSDGLANVGPQSVSALQSLGSRLNEEGISVSTIGLGDDYDEDLMTGLARAAGGNHAFVAKINALPEIFSKELNATATIVADNITVTLTLAPEIRLQRLLAEEVAERTKKGITTSLAKLHAEQDNYLLFELSGDFSELTGSIKIAEITIEYRDLLKDGSLHTWQESVYLQLSDDQNLIANSRNLDILANVSSFIAINRNKEALELRDKGDVDGAKNLLQDNALYLKSQAAILNAPQLATEALQNEENARQLNEEDWKVQRKMMREQQYKSETKQVY